MQNIILNSNREQAVYSVNQPVVLEASAGSGKTTALVERYCAVLIYVLTHVIQNLNENDNFSVYESLNRITALTFTRKAASEMKDRVRKKIKEIFTEENITNILEKLVLWNGDFLKQSVEKTSVLLKNYKSLVLDSLSAAKITTIDSFALSLLRRFPVETGIDPSAAPADDNGEDSFSITYLDAYQDACRKLLDTANPDFAFCIANTGYQNTSAILKDLYKLCYEKGRNAVEEALSQSGYLDEYADLESFWNKTIRPVLETISASITALIEDKTVSGRSVPGAMDTVLRIERVLKKNAPLDLFYQDLTYKNKNSKILEATERLYQKLNFELNRILTVKLWNCTKIILKQFENLKASRNELSFSDIEQRLLLTLKANSNFLEAVRKDILYILLDEYQDTSDTQKEIFDLLLINHNKFSMIPFAVGDPKQSIYGFRNANAALFSQTRNEWQEIAEKSGMGEIGFYLNKNYRSAPGLVNFNNTAFSSIFSDNGSPQYIPQEAQADISPEDCGKVCFIEEEGETADELFENASRNTAKQIVNWIESGRYKPGDIMVLMRKKSKSSILQTLFREILGNRNIPYYLVDTANILEEPEISELIVYLEALDRPESDYFFLPLLKSSFFRRTDAQILTYKRHGNNLFSALKDENSSEMIRFEQIRSMKNRLSISELAEFIARETGYQAYLSTLPDRKEASTSLIVFLNRLRAIQNIEMFNLTGFLYYLQEYGVSFSKPQIIGEKSDVVRVLSVHSAKGLESKAVIYIATTGVKSSPSQVRFIRKDGKNRIGFSFTGKDNHYLEISEELKNREFLEEKRLAYVAFTRAKEDFCYTGIGDAEKGKDGWKECIHTGLSFIHDKLAEPASISSQPNAQTVDQSGFMKKVQEKAEILELNRKETKPSILSVFTVTQLLDSEFSPDAFAAKYISRSFPIAESLLEIAEEEDVFSETGNRADLGTFLHKIFETSGPENYLLNLEAALPLEKEAIIKEKEKLIRLAKAYYQSSFYQEITAGKPEIRSEMEIRYPVTLNEYTIHIKGTVDKYIIRNNNGLVLDYKLKIGNKTERYGRQLQYYSFFLKEMGYPADEMRLYDMETAEAVKIKHETLPIQDILKKQIQNMQEILWKSGR